MKLLKVLICLLVLGCGKESPTTVPQQNTIEVTISNSGQVVYLALWLTDNPNTIQSKHIYSGTLETEYNKVIDYGDYETINWFITDLSNNIGCEVEGYQSTEVSELNISFKCVD